jgi:hypothetical protein
MAQSVPHFAVGAIVVIASGGGGSAFSLCRLLDKARAPRGRVARGKKGFPNAGGHTFAFGV